MKIDGFRGEELDLDPKVGLPKDVGPELYQPRMRPCACGCGQMVLAEWTCEGEAPAIERLSHG